MQYRKKMSEMTVTVSDISQADLEFKFDLKKMREKLTLFFCAATVFFGVTKNKRAIYKNLFGMVLQN